MPDFWQFPTVSMGLGPLMAIYQARFMKYLQDRGLAQTEGRKVWAFMGDGEMDEPESMGAIGMASRENLDNLIFVVNCNLQRLDGPVRGNGKIIQELESDFRGAGWNVIKVDLGHALGRAARARQEGHPDARMMECVDGEYQTFKSKDGAYVREYFFNTPELKELVADWSDDEIWNLNRGGHDPHKIYAAYHAAVNHKGQPTVILAKTIKGYGMGESGEAQNITHQQKKMSHESIRSFRDRFQIPVPDDKLDEVPYVNVPGGLAGARVHARAADGARRLPAARAGARRQPLVVPELSAFERFLKSTDEREISTTMAFVQILQIAAARQEPRQARRADRARRVAHVRHGRHVPPARHLEPAGPALHAAGPRPADVLQGGQGRPDPAGRHQRGRRDVRLDGGGDVVLDARRADDPVLHLLFDVRLPARRRPRAGPRATCARAASCWAAPRAARRSTAKACSTRTATRTCYSATVPNCISYDPTFAYEVAVIIQDGLRRMYAEQEDVYYYLTVMNENYTHPAMPEGAAPAILKGMYKFKAGAAKAKAPRVQLLGSGVDPARGDRGGGAAEAATGASTPTSGAARRSPSSRATATRSTRWNMLHPADKPRRSHVETCLDGHRRAR